MGTKRMQMYQVSVDASQEDGLVVITQPKDFEDDQVIVLSVEQSATVAKWLKEISEGA